MPHRDSILMGALICALTCTAAAQDSQPGKADPAAPRATPVATTGNPQGIARASDFIGKNIVDGSGKTVGEIKDLIACGQSGELIALVERDSDDKLVGVPMGTLSARVKGGAPDKDAVDTNDDGKDDALAADTVKVDEFVLLADQKFATAPIVPDKDKIDPAWWPAFAKHYDIKLQDAKAARDPAGRESDPAKAKERDPAGKETAATSDPGHDALCVEKLIGQDVKTASGEDIGDVKDVAVNLKDGKIAYVVISTGGAMGIGNTFHGVRIGALKQDAERKFVTLPTDKATLEHTAGIDIDHLPAHPSFEVSAATPSSIDRGEKERVTPR